MVYVIPQSRLSSITVAIPLVIEAVPDMYIEHAQIRYVCTSNKLQLCIVPFTEVATHWNDLFTIILQLATYMVVIYYLWAFIKFQPVLR